MDEVSIVAIDLAKRSFQLHGARADGSVALRKTLRRGKLLSFVASVPRCVVVMEACASAHYWGREIMALGHEVRLVAPIYVKPFVKRQKNDEADAEAICEAGQRPTMRFVAVKGAAQQARGMLFRTRDLLVRQRTQTINALRGHLAEFGLVAPQGRAHVARLALALDEAASGLPPAVHELGRLLLEQIAALDAKIAGLEKEIGVHARHDEEAARLMTIPGIGPICAMAIQAFAPPLDSFRCGRDVAAWLGAGAAPALDRGQAPARQDLEDGPARPQAAAGLRRHGAGALGHPAGRDRGPLAGPDAGAQAEDGGGGGAGQPDGAHRLGADGEQGGLPSSRRGRGLNGRGGTMAAMRAGRKDG